MSAAKQYFPGTGTGTGDGKAPAEKSKFVQTCNRLSLFLKERGNLRDLNLGINAKFDPTGVPETSPVITPAKATTVDLLIDLNDSGEKAEKSATSILPQYVILDSSDLEDSTKKPSLLSKPITKPTPTPTPTPTTAQMTIFYGGKVVVVDDVPADRARDLIQVAKTGAPISIIENRIELASTSKPESMKEELQGKDSDLPIARRASLHKFLAKRKDRATVRAAPYQLHNQSPAASSSGTEHSFDLNL